ncbi:MAG: competence/damage-inducible protein A [Firmicutes bacterium]|nr:competence/damage-inducible protein A [Bacillota bacterium]
MKTAILTVGTEILFGQVVNTNAAYLSKSLQNLGYDVMYHYTVGDNPGRLKELLDFAYHDCDLIITTGGLGPTQDDLTKEIISEYFGEKLVEYPDQLKILTDHFKNSRYKWTENNRKQAWFPENNCTVLANPHGTAPGFMISKNGKNIIAMPGPPREMTEMFETHVKPILESKRDSVIYYKIIRTINLGESSMETILLPLIDGQTDPTIATYAKEGECTLRIASQRDTEEEASAAVDEMTERVRKLAGEYIYSFDDEELNEVVVRILKEKGLTIASSESCTGGLFAAAITDVPGASEVLSSSYVTYSNESKKNEIGVPADTIERFGVVSKETAIAMAAGTKKRSGADIAVSITGFAGPESDPGHEAGEAYIGYAMGDIKGHVEIHTSRNFRMWNRRYFTLRMLRVVYMLIR